MLIRTSLEDPQKMTAAIQAAVRRVCRHAPLFSVTTLDYRLGAYLTPRHVQTSLVVGFPAIAILLAAIGIYRLIQYSVVTRTQEIGSGWPWAKD